MDVTDLVARAPLGLSLTKVEHLELVTSTADELIQRFPTSTQLAELEAELLSSSDSTPLLVHVATKAARSKAIVRELKVPAHVSVVFAVFKEHQRIRPVDVHEHGEDFLVRKLSQLDWLFGDAPNIDWDLRVVDDGCPEGSGRIAKEIVDAQGAGDRAKVLFLAEGIARGGSPVAHLTSTTESRKGGSIQYGMWDAVQVERENHIVVFTDADLSTHLGQIGLLLDGILNHGCEVAIASRREPASVVVKQGVRNVRGKLFIYLWKRLLPLLDEVVDTQCGFKAFRAEVVRDVVPGMLEQGFAFDIELLLRAELRRRRSLIKVPIAWIDSEAASTTTDLQPYLPMLRAAAGLYRHYLPATPKADAFAEFIEGLSDDGWARLLEAVPSEIAAREPKEFGTFDEVSVDQLIQATIRA